MRDFWSRSAELRLLVIAALCVLLWLALVRVAGAETASISFVRPTTYTNGQPLLATAITGFEFRCGAGTSTGVTCTALTLAGTATAGTMAITVPAEGGTACIEGRTLVAAGPGPYSSPACKAWPAWKPGAPGTVTVVVVTG